MCLCLVVFFGKYEGTSNQTCPSCTKMCCLDVLDIAMCLLLQPPMQCQKTWLCISKKKSSRWLDIWDMVKSVFFQPPMQRLKSNGFELVKYCIKVWCEVDCQLTTVWQILEIKQDGKLLQTLLLLSFLQMSFLENSFIDLLWQSSSSAQIRL